MGLGPDASVEFSRRDAVGAATNMPVAVQPHTQPVGQIRASSTSPMRQSATVLIGSPEKGVAEAYGSGAGRAAALMSAKRCVGFSRSGP